MVRSIFGEEGGDEFLSYDCIVLLYGKVSYWRSFNWVFYMM